MTTQEILQGVHDWTNGKIVYDISVAHPDGQGNPTKYATLAAALGTNGANIPDTIRKGGMSIKFIQNSDNKYVQYRLMAQNFTTDVTQWQGVDEITKNVSIKVNKIQRTFNEVAPTTTVSSLSFSSDGVISSEEISTHKVVYSQKLTKGTNIICTLLTNRIEGRPFNFGFTSVNPSEQQTLVGLQLTNVSCYTVKTTEKEIYIEVPYDGYFVYYYYNQNWETRDFILYLTNDDNTVIDVSALNAKDGVLATYETLAEALAAVPVSCRNGGVTIKYIDSTTNLYVQYRLMYPSWTTRSSSWRGEESTPTLGSNNLITSGGTHRGLTEIGKVYQDTVDLDVEAPNTWKHILSDIYFYPGNYYEVEISRTGESRNIIYGLGWGNTDNLIEIIRTTETEFTLKFEIPSTANRNFYFLEARATTTTPLTGEIAITAIYKTPLESKIDKKIGDVATEINNNISSNITIVNQQMGILSDKIDSVEHDLQESDNGGIITQNEIVNTTHSTKGTRIGNHYAVTEKSINSTFYVRISNPYKHRLYISTLRRNPPQYYTSGDLLTTLLYSTKEVIEATFTIPEGDKTSEEFVKLIGIYTIETDESFTVDMFSYKNSINVNGFKVDTAKEDIKAIQTNYSQLSSDVDAIENVIFPGTDIVKLNDIAKTLYRIKSAKKTVINGNETEVTPLMLLHFSDIHANDTGLARIKQFAQYYTEYLDDVICTGDLVYAHLLPVETTMAFWNNAEVSSYLTCVGNHEGSFNSEGATAKQVYDGIIAPYVSNWGNVVQPANASENGLSYYYKDYAASNVRLIVLDAYTHGDDSYRSNQATWLSNVLADALTNGLSVLCAIHQAGSNLTKFDCAFSQMSSDWNGSGIPTSFTDAVDTFMTSGGDFIAWIAGHTHRDVCGVDSVYNKQLKIIIDCTKFSDSGELIRLENDKSYDLFNLVAVDTVNKTIKFIRIGADLDMYLRKRETMSIQYASNSYSTIATPTVISNNGD